MREDSREARRGGELGGAELSNVPATQAVRARIVAAMVLIVSEQGFARATVSGVCVRARVSRGTFYESFDGLQDCFIAVIDDGYRRAHALISEAFEGQRCWRAGLRAAVGALLVFFDDEPLLARVWLVETLAAGSWALERRERHVAALTELIIERWPLPEGAEVNPLASRAAIESVLAIIHGQLLTGSEGPLVALLGPLMGLISTAFLGPRAAARDVERGHAHALQILAERQSRATCASAREVEIPAVLRNPRAHRTRECLYYVASNPGASNRQIATALGIARQEQISKVLARLYAIGLLLKRAGPPGGANAWSLTSHGTQVIHALRNQYTTSCSLSPRGDPPCATTHLDTYTCVTSETPPLKS
jgi:AcrR family transcriptional regulator